MSSSSHRLLTLDALRGIAALWVCWYHFTQGNTEFLEEGWLKSSGSFGWLGVEIFFVISGFIIPYALFRSEYRTSDYGTFLLKRITRLDPPYIAGILIVIILGYISTVTPGFRGPPFQLSATQVILHLGYANVLFGHPWLNPVFWTLAIELQYYLLAGLLFPALAHRSNLLRAFAFGCLGSLVFLFPNKEFLFHWLFLFMFGMAAFQFRAGIIQRGEFMCWIVVLGVGSWFAHGAVITGTGIATSLIIALYNARINTPFLFLGNISYSLYLIHIPVGSKVINLGLRFFDTFPGRTVVLICATAASITAAWLLYRYVELPAQRWSSSIRYRGKQKPLPGIVSPSTESALI
ncbi:MAG: acyltransferase [Verrucomicrobiota bacterium]